MSSFSLTLVMILLCSLRSHCVYVCQDNEVTLTCPPGSSITLQSVFYGRTQPSRGECTAGPNDQTTTCQSSPSSVRNVLSHCQGEESCSVQASNLIFTDPCPGTAKYLQLEYSCADPCAPLAVSPHGRWNGNGVVDLHVGAHNTWTCDELYTSIPPNPVLTCQSNSQWDDVIPRCERPNTACASLAVIPHGSWYSLKDGQEVPVDYSTAGYMICDEGYTLIGDEVLTCVNTQWDKPLPRCDPTEEITLGECIECVPPSTTIPLSSFRPVTFQNNYQYSSVLDTEFPFPFAGTNPSKLLVSPNGYLTFDTSSTQAILPVGTVLPSSDIKAKSILAYWATDLDSMAIGSTYSHATVGDPGSRTFVLSISGVPYANSNSSSLERLSVEVALFEKDGHIEFYYHYAPTSTQLVTVGVQPTGSTAQAGLYNGGPPINSITSKALIWQQQPSVDSKKSPNLGAIIGGVIGGILGVGLIITFIIWRCRKKIISPPSLSSARVLKTTRTSSMSMGSQQV